MGLTLLLLPRHPLVSDDKEIGEAVTSRSMTRRMSGSPGLMQAVCRDESVLIEIDCSDLSLVTINP